ncbi:MAG: gamma-glutamyl-gamma-aminobutyrate hydrolase family protein [Bacillota bacterium]
MLDQRPLIAITPGFDYNGNKMYIHRGYYEGISLAGGLPVLLPTTEDEGMLSDIIERFDGFLLSGGPDVDASYFGEWNYKYTGEISPYRDKMEIFIAREVVSRNKPVFGICRGIQVLNVALGGTIYQDVYSQIKDRELVKHSQDAPRWYPTHNINIEKGSKVYESHGKEIVCVNSFHHQAVKDLAPGFEVTSRCDDGIIESIENPKCRFAVGVQWHPELMWEKDSAFLKLFENFVNACRL